MPRSIRRRLSLSYIALVILSMGALSAILYFLIYNAYLTFQKQNLLSLADLLASQSTEIIQAGPPYDGLVDLARQFQKRTSARATIIAPDGRVLADSDFEADLLENHASRPEIRQALAGTSASVLRYSQTADIEMLYTAAPIIAGSRVIAVSRLAYSLDQLRVQMSAVRRAMVLVTLIAIFFAILSSLFLGRFTIRPLQELARSVRNMGDEGVIQAVDFSQPVDEISDLERTYRDLANQLNSRIQQLNAERSTISAVLTQMNDGILITDRQGVIQLINPAACRLFSTEEDEATGRSLIEVVRNHQIVDLWQRSQNSRSQVSSMLETNPNRLTIQAIATPLAEILSESTLMVFHDLTRLRRLEVVRQDFVSNVSHELRTPLASLKALTDTLLEGALEDLPAARNFLLRMDIEIDNLTQIVRELLELSRIESGRVPIEKKAVPVETLIAPPYERMQLQAERAGLTLSTELAENLPPVSADAGRIGQVLVNLIHNAIKFTPPGGHITVGAYSEPMKVILFVRDTGVGIDAEALPRIFERFYKADQSRSGGGTGLGLSICRHLVEAHNGRIWAESVQGQGSTFFFSLPIAQG